MNETVSGIIAANLSSIDASQRQEALQGWNWLATLAERATGERPCAEDERVAHWLGRLQEEGMGAFGLHAEVGLAFFASIGHRQAIGAILDAAMDDSQPLNARWVGAGAEALANQALCLAARGCTDDRAVELVLQMQSRDLQVNLPGDAGITPLHAASASGREHLVRALLACGADPVQADERGYAALHHLALVPVWRSNIAGLEARAKIAEALLSAGADLEQKDSQGQSARSALARAGWSNEAMVQAQANLSHQPRTRGPGSSRRH